MRLKPLVEALGLQPAFWSRWHIVSRQVLHDERRSHEQGFTPRISAMGQEANRNARFLRVMR